MITPARVPEGHHRGRRRRAVDDAPRGPRSGSAARDDTSQFPEVSGLCLAPTYVAEDLIRAEGITDLQYVDAPGVPDVYDRLATGAIDFAQWYGVPFIEEIDKGRPVTVLAGVHIGCNELFATPAVKTIRDLKDKSIAVAYASPANSIIAAMLAYVGLDHRKYVRYVQHTAAESIELLAAGKIDALMATPPVNQELRARKIGHVVVATAVDRPWSQYFCCLFAGNRDFVKKHPVTAKRVMRAIVKADQLCAQEPEGVARPIVDRGFTKSYDYALQALKEVPYGKWRQYDPEDTVRFYPCGCARRDDQGHAAEDHRPGHRLAIPGRAEEGAEGMIARRTCRRRHRRRRDGRSARAPGRGRSAAGAGDDADPPCKPRACARRRSTSRRSCCAARDSPTSATSRRTARTRSRSLAARRNGHQHALRRRR